MNALRTPLLTILMTTQPQAPRAPFVHLHLETQLQFFEFFEVESCFNRATVTVSLKIFVVEQVFQPHLRVGVQASHSSFLSQGLHFMRSHHTEGHILVLGPSLGRLLASAVAWLEQSSHLPRLVRTFLRPCSTLTN